MEDEVAAEDIGRTILPRLYERDIDVLMQEELIFNRELRKQFAKSLGISGAFSVNECQLSVSDVTGETDVYATISVGESRGVLLIENKIDAAFQPRQPERYRERAQAIAANNPKSVVYCVLIAPSQYVAAGSGAIHNFDAVITYEEIAKAIERDDTPRSKYRASLLLRALEKARNAYVMAPSAEVGDLWMRIYQIARSEFPGLHMAEPSAKGSNSKWLIFKADLPPRVTIDWKITKGTMELSFWKATKPCPTAQTDLATLPGAQFLILGETTAISLPVPRPPKQWTTIEDSLIREALATAHSLLMFYRTEKAKFT